MSTKQEQEVLKQPDEFQKMGQEAVPWLEQHAKTVATGVGGAVVVGLVIAIGTSMGSRGEEEAAQAFGKSLQVLEREVNASATEVKPGAPAPFKSEAEKDEAIVAALTEFRGKYSGKKASVAAALPLAQALLRQGKADAALPLVDEYLAKADPADPLRPAGFEARGYALEQQKKYDEALAAFDLLSREGKTDFLKGMGQYHRARMLLLKGDSAGGAKGLSEIEAAAPNTAAARLAKERLALLASQGVAVPTPPPAPAPAPTPAPAQ